MAFIRVKNVAGKRYGYLVQNSWKKRIRSPRQRVSKYLGRIVSFPHTDEIKMTPNEMNKHDTITFLVRETLRLCGFEQKGELLSLSEILFDPGSLRFVNERGKEQSLVMEINEGFLCTYTINRLLQFQNLPDEDEREKGIRLAKCFLEAGLRIDPSIFVTYFEKV